MFYNYYNSLCYNPGRIKEINQIKEKESFLKRYLAQAPIFLAMERAIECRLISELEFKKPILDLGCGDGLFSSILLSETDNLGIDISFDELVKCSKRKQSKKVAAGDICMLPLKSGSFNTIICNSVMEHVPDIKKALREAQRVLSSGGKFIITLPTENYEKFLFYPSVLQGLGLKKTAGAYRGAVKKIFKHYHAYPTAQWLNLIGDNGFRVLRARPYFPRKVMALSDFYLPFSSLSLLNKKIFKRWIIWPALRKFMAGFLELSLRKFYLYNHSSKGACVLIEATRR
jgi:ubiquinone/menaquinone biosynthesis C-methylase UbiE